jgi:hypothetical protein
MDDINRPIVRTCKLLTYNDFICTKNQLLNSGRIKELGIIPLTTNSATVLTNSLKEVYYRKEVPKSYYSEIEFDFEWELKNNVEKDII